MSIGRKITIGVLLSLTTILLGLSGFIAIRILQNQAPYDSSVADGDTCNFAQFGPNDPVCPGFCCFCNKCGGEPLNCNNVCEEPTSSSSSSTTSAVAFQCLSLAISPQSGILPGQTISVSAQIQESTSNASSLAYILNPAGQQASVSGAPSISAQGGNVNIYTFSINVPSSASGSFSVRFSPSGSINDLVTSPAGCSASITISSTSSSSSSTSSESSSSSSSSSSSESSTTSTSTTTPGTGGGTSQTTSQPTGTVAGEALPDTALFDSRIDSILLGMLLIILGLLAIRTNALPRAMNLMAMVFPMPDFDESRQKFEDKFNDD